MSGDLRNRFVSRFAAILGSSLLFLLLIGQTTKAEIYHYKNFLVGDRASLMGGAYAAISDDAAGAFYNPAGISFAYGDSISGSGNAFHNVDIKYKKALGSEDWERSSSALLPNFFGFIKKYGDHSFALSYIVPETMIEHQDQTFHNPTPKTARYSVSLHSEDHIYEFGPSYALKLTESLSIGATLYYFYREFRQQQESFANYTALGNPASGWYTEYSSIKKIEKGFTPRMGLQFSPSDQLVFGLMVSQTSLFSTTYDHTTSKANSSGAYLHESHSTIDRKTPTQVTMGVAYYPSPFLLLSGDFDYFIANEGSLNNVLNLSFGSELFLDNKNALRFGLFTNNDSRKAPSAATTSQEKVDLNGISFGYSTFSRSSSVTLGMIYSTGSGKSQITGSSDIYDMERTSMTVVFAATYNY